MSDKAVIPSVRDMEDDIFMKHCDARHAHELGATFAGMPEPTPYVLDVTRAAHDYFHRSQDASPELEHDHVHLEETT